MALATMPQFLLQFLLCYAGLLIDFTVQTGETPQSVCPCNQLVLAVEDIAAILIELCHFPTLSSLRHAQEIVGQSWYIEYIKYLSCAAIWKLHFERHDASSSYFKSVPISKCHICLLLQGMKFWEELVIATHVTGYTRIDDPVSHSTNL